jgi:hypothetical protein
MEDIGVDGRIILKDILKNRDRRHGKGQIARACERSRNQVTGFVAASVV